MFMYYAQLHLCILESYNSIKFTTQDVNSLPSLGTVVLLSLCEVVVMRFLTSFISICCCCFRWCVLICFWGHYRYHLGHCYIGLLGLSASKSFYVISHNLIRWKNCRPNILKLYIFYELSWFKHDIKSNLNYNWRYGQQWCQCPST